MKATLAIVLAAVGVLLLLSACSDDDSATASPSVTESSASTESSTPLPTSTASGAYTSDRFGYSVMLPSGWRTATQFMDAYAATGAQPFGVGYSRDNAVFTDISVDDESAFVQRVTSETPVGLTGIEVWLDFLLKRTVEIYPTSATREQLLKSVSEGNVWRLVTNVRDVQLTSGEVATRYDLELASDYGHFVYDTVLVPALDNCARCRSFIIQTMSAGVPSTGPWGTAGIPPAAYPKPDFEAIVAGFRAEMFEPVPSADYADPQLGFSFSYPGDLILTDLTGPTPGAGRERVLQFESADNRARGFIVSVDEEDVASLEDWAVVQAACMRSGITPTTLGGEPALSCERDVLGPLEPAVMAGHDGRIFLITSGQDLTEVEFTDIIESFEF